MAEHGRRWLLRLLSLLIGSGGLKASPPPPLLCSLRSFSVAYFLPPAPLAPIRSASGALLGAVSSMPDGSPDPLLESALRSYARRLATEESSRALARERAARGEAPLPRSSVWLVSDRH